MVEDTLITEVSGRIGKIILNRVEKANSLTWEMLKKIQNTLEQWAEEDSIRVVVFTGSGEKAFCSGFDIRSIPTGRSLEGEHVSQDAKPLEGAFEAVKNFPYPTIARINGYAFGAGLNLAVCCDFRFATDDVSVCMPPTKLGLVYHANGIKQFIDVIGPNRTKDVFITANTYKGIEAKEIGLIDKLIPRAELDAAVNHLINQLSERAPLALKGTKKVLKMLLEADMILSPLQTDEADTLMKNAIESDDLKEAQQAFIEKRKPVFTGK